ncbi:MAG: hypothetical protein IPG91_01465 [Ideonella sp.]|nr:hypothetical protein [Ideonella sp.]
MLGAIVWSFAVFAAVARAADVPAAAEGPFGLYSSADFTVGPGRAEPRPPQRQAAWYFRDEIVAVPREGLPLAAFEPGVRPFDDVARWSAARPAGAALDYPPLVWVAAPLQVRHARLAGDKRELVATAQGTLPWRLVPKIALNRSYVDATSLAFFATRELALRGAIDGGVFVARTVWPEDFRLGPQAPSARALPPGEAAQALRTLMREEPRGGAQSPYAAMTLWQREGGRADWAGRPVIGLMVNGAQGDDDEAHGGHFAIVTGRVQADGSIGNWLVNNFYSLDVESEKGIIAAPVPLDNYLADLNSGQGWYRPTTMLVAVLADERAAVLVQSALNRVYKQFYRHQLVYYHPNQNCASISVDTLRALGWDVPARGPSSRVLAWLGYPFIAIRDRSIDKARLAFDYLRTDQTRLMPAAALEQAFASLLEIGHAPAAARDGLLATLLAQDLEALTFLRFPQFPSSRAFGNAPAVSTWEYHTLVPADPAMAQIVPVPPRPFPPELRDPDLLPLPWTPADYATLAWAVLSIVGLPWAAWWWWKRRRTRRAQALPR